MWVDWETEQQYDDNIHHGTANLGGYTWVITHKQRQQPRYCMSVAEMHGGGGVDWDCWCNLGLRLMRDQAVRLRRQG